MATCDVCGNDYDKSFEIRRGPVTYTFDCFECAIHRLAPQCAHCACRVIGHGVESEGQIYCCANCARKHGMTDVVDRGDERNTVEAIGRAARPEPATGPGGWAEARLSGWARNVLRAVTTSAGISWPPSNGNHVTRSPASRIACCSRALASNGRIVSRRPCETKTRRPRRRGMPARHAALVDDRRRQQHQRVDRLIRRERDVRGDHRALRVAGEHLPLAGIAALGGQLGEQRADPLVRCGEPGRVRAATDRGGRRRAAMRVEVEPPPRAPVPRTIGRLRRLRPFGQHEAASRRQPDRVGERDPLVGRRAVAVDAATNGSAPVPASIVRSPDPSMRDDVDVGRQPPIASTVASASASSDREASATTTGGSSAGHRADDQERLACRPPPPPAADRRARRATSPPRRRRSARTARALRRCRDRGSCRAAAGTAPRRVEDRAHASPRPRPRSTPRDRGRAPASAGAAAGRRGCRHRPSRAHGSVCTSTDSTGGRSRTIALHESPPSGEA